MEVKSIVFICVFVPQAMLLLWLALWLMLRRAFHSQRVVRRVYLDQNIQGGRIIFKTGFVASL